MAFAPDPAHSTDAGDTGREEKRRWMQSDDVMKLWYESAAAARSTCAIASSSRTRRS